MAILKIKDKGVWKEIQAIKGDTGHDVYVGDKSKAPSEAKLIIEPVKGTATGTDIQVTDSANDRVSKLVLDGKSTQETRSGKNLFKPIATAIRNGMVFKNNGDGSYSLNGTATGNTSFYVTGLNYKIGTYTLSLNNSVVISNGGFYAQMETSAGNIRTIFDAINAHRTATTKASITALSIVIPSGLTLNNFIFKPQLEEGSTITSFEPYGVMPSPDYPSEIENVKGKYLLPNNVTSQTMNGVTFTANNDKTITVNGTSTAVTDLYIVGSANEYVDLGLSTGNYILSGCPVGGNKNSYMLFAIQKRGDKLYYYQEIGTGLNIYVEAGDTFKIFIRILSGKEVVNALYKPMLSKKGENYVPYGNIQIVETGKNIAKFDQSENTNINSWIYTSNVANNITATKKGTGDSFYATFVANVVKDEQYVFSTSTSNHISMYCYSDKLWGTGIKGLSAVGLSSAVPLKFTSTYTGQMIIGLYGTTTSVEAKDFQLEKGSTATDYEPYKEEVVNIDLKGNELCSLPNGTKDELIVKDGRAKILKKIGKVVLDGSDDENWIKYNAQSFEDTVIFGTDKGISKGNYNDRCNMFQTGKSYWAINEEGLYTTTSGLRIRISKERGNTVDEFKIWLSTHNTIVQYELETPEEIDLGEVSMLTTYEDVSNITNSEDTNMSIEYDTNKTNLYYQNNGNIIKMNEGS